MRRLHGLDALRGIAAIIVFGHHLVGVYGSPAAANMAALLSVDLFFMLSGFVLARSYGKRFEAGLGATDFILIRYRRLCAPVVVGALIGAIHYGLAGMLTFSVALSFLTTSAFLPALWIPTYLFPLNWPVWSLFAEIFTNAAHAAFAKVKPVHLLAIFVPAWVITVIAYRGPVVGMQDWTFIPGLFRAGAAYFIGAQLHCSFGDRPFGRWPMLGLGAFPIVAFALQWLPAEIADMLFVAGAAPLIVRSAVGLQPCAWAAAIGALSFPLYAVHAPIIRLGYFLNFPIAVTAFAALASAVAITFFWERRFALGAKATAVQRA